MNSRERVLAAVEHRIPDRVPVDLGGTVMSGIMAQPLAMLMQHYGLNRPPKVYELFQMLGQVEPDMVELLGIDVLPVEPRAIFFDIPRENYKPWKLFDGTDVLVPGQFNVEIGDEGQWLLREGGDPNRPVVAKMPKDGFYFDQLWSLAFNMDFVPPPLAEIERIWKKPVCSEDIDYIAAEAERLRQTDKALLLSPRPAIGPAGMGSMPEWLCLMASNAEYVDRLVEIRTEVDQNILGQLHQAIGDNVDIICIDGNDYGTQRGEMFSIEMFQRFYVPYYTAINGWIHEHTSWKTWKHSCGSIPNFIPMLIESGLDCLNPVQCSAEGMDAQLLKDRFGARLAFWGGGVDTQKTLPFGTPEEVYDEVRERIRIFNRGGGYVFCPVHNVQANTPVENILAMFEAVRDSGG